QASTSELFGKAQEIPQKETTPFYPRSPYAAAKLYAYWITVNYREAYASNPPNGSWFNNKSPSAAETFFTPKSTAPARPTSHGLQQKLFLGDLNAERDWGHARDYVEGMWMMLQQAKPDDYVLATGEAHSVREFVEKAFAHVGKTIVWRGSGVEEKGFEKSTGRVLVEIDPRYFRLTEVDTLLGDASKAQAKLGWRHKTSFDTLVADMVEADMVAVVEERKRRNPHA